MDEEILLRRLARPGLVAALLVALALAAGGDAWGRLALRAGLPKLAAALLTDPVARAVAQLQTGDADAADAAFAATGAAADYDRAASLAARGQFDLSVAYYDSILFVDPHDEDAAHNRAVVAPFATVVVAPPDDSHGRMPATETAEGHSVETRELAIGAGPEQRRTYRPVTAQAMQAGESWLDTVSDSPGEYLRKRLAAEYAQRARTGLGLDGERR